MTFYSNVLKYLKECKVALADRFAPYFTIGVCNHIVNLENQKREFYTEHGRVANLRTHVFMCAPPGFTKTLYLEKFLKGKQSIVGSSAAFVNCGFEGSMCLPAGQRIQMADGNRKRIEDIEPGDEVVCINDDWEMTHRNVTNTFQMKGKVVEVTLRSGRRIKVTDNHPLLQLGGWIEAGRLKVEDRVAIARRVSVSGETDIYAKAYILGYMLADGNFDNMTFACAKKEILHKTKEAVAVFDQSVRQTAHDPKIEYGIIDRGSGVPNRLKEWFKELGLVYRTDIGWKGRIRDEKFIPDVVFTWDDSTIRWFIDGLFNGDAMLGEKEITLSNLSGNIIRGSQHLLVRLGIHSHVWYDGSANGIWKLRITDSRYLDMYYGRERANNSSSKLDTIPKSIWKVIEELKGPLSWNKLSLEAGWSLQQCRNRGGNIPYTNFLKTCRVLPDLYKYANLYWDEVKKIEVLGDMDVYNLSVDKYHNFLVDDVITHNTEAGFTGTVKVVNGEPVEVKGAAYENRMSIMGIDEFASLTNAMRQEHSINLDNAMLTALDSGFLIKRLALGKIQYITQLTLFTGSQPMRFNLTSGLGRRFIYIWFIPTRDEEQEIRESRRMAKSYLTDFSVVNDLKADLKKVVLSCETIEKVKFDQNIYKLFDKIHIPHFEETLYERMAIGYTLARDNGADKTLEVSMDRTLKELFEQANNWRLEIKKGAETSQVYQVVKEMSGASISDVKKRLTDLGLSYSQSSNVMNILERQGRIRYVKEAVKGKGGRPRTLVIAAEN